LTRTGLSARLSAHRNEPYVDIHPQDAEKYGIKDNGLVKVCSRLGDVIVRSQLNFAQ
jgi:assimilatory nitrate reductase catalytic subunit